MNLINILNSERKKEVVLHMPATFLVFQTYLLIIFKYLCGFSGNPWTIHAEPFAATEPSLRITAIEDYVSNTIGINVN